MSKVLHEDVSFPYFTIKLFKVIANIFSQD